MKPDQISLVQQTFERTWPISAHVTATFYAELFALDPDVRGLFKGDMIVQGEKLMRMLSEIVRALPDPESVMPRLRELAVLHVSYGVEARHYGLVDKALMRTLKHELGAAFTPEAREAWQAAYATLSRAMCEAAYGRPASPAP